MGAPTKHGISCPIVGACTWQARYGYVNIMHADICVCFHALRVHHRFRRAALPGRPLRATNHEPRITKKHWRSSHLSCRIQAISVWLYTFTPSGHEIRHKRLTRFCASQSSFKTGSLLIPGNPGRIESRSFPTNHEPLTTNKSPPPVKRVARLTAISLCC